MKKVVFLLLASFLVLTACGNEESKLEDKKETKESDKESNKDDKKKDDDKEKEKSDDKSNEEVATQDETTEQPVQSQEQVNTQEQPIQSQEQEPVAEEQPVQQEPTDQEKMEANAKVAKEHGYTGIPNGDAGLLEPADEYYSNDQLDPETGLPMDDAVPHKTNE
ncbi:hypothetical protein QI282_11820 [Staphylococcus saprophyticus]|uniref:hypothetical protein n=1 Tax=Staphylococcus saprophyticus TaxID=29385 RepID=UPI00076AF481|nr:hypothetical protein [Staphylococcus saprophyticus]AMG20030.1 hypothetical protein AL528_07470 [Staphylococcus saprophyticus]MDW4016114.1 hypothetical protein [Staphylococcus saprophyticus]